MGRKSKIFGWIYGIQAFMVFPWFTGAIYRDEQSMWIWQEYYRAAKKFGTTDALFSAYCYLVFYSVPFVITYFTTGILFQNVKLDSVTRGLFGVWATSAFLLLYLPFCAFVRAMPDDPFNGWLSFLWLLWSLFMISLFGNLCWKCFFKKEKATE